MKLSTWAKKQGISYKTAWRLWKTGRLPLPAEQLATGTIIVKEPEASYEAGASSVVLYARVSSSDQKQDLDRQISRLVEYMEALLSGCGRRIIVVDESEMKEDLEQDMIEVLTSFCARLYGRRLAKDRARKVLKEIEKC